jgi:coproporphyrinogen III oxidase
MKTEIANYIKSLQDQITSALSEIDKNDYKQDIWERPGGGGGRTRVFMDGAVFEKAGVNVSEVYGTFPTEFAKTLPLGDGLDFYATGVSLVLHPINPFAPTVHANFRYIERGNAGWFGGGADLTPVYPFIEDAKHFHQTFKTALDPHGIELYPKFKHECDTYFYLPHRQETRGVGGIFFDYQERTEKNFKMLKACGDQFLNAYLPIVTRRKDQPYTETQKDFQEYRRGRYVEFNLLYDRGTTFGLKTNGRVESILMSLPKKVQWWYDHQAAEGTAEAKLKDFLRPRDWLNE